MTPDPLHIWQAVQTELKRTVRPSTYDIWLAPLQPMGVDDGVIVVRAPEEIRAWVAERFAARLDACAARALGPGTSVRILGGDGASAATAGETPPVVPPARTAEPELNPKYSFDHFVIGDTNRFAHAAALAVAELPGQAYNPLFIYGPPGVGKTHLLHSIGNYVRTYGDGLTVRYTTVERFTNEFVAAAQSRSTSQMDRFKDRYRANDVLLIDDVQFLQDKARTEEEFFHTFNALHDAGCQLVLTSDRLPRDLAALEDRLRERFESGLVTDIRAPDLPTRLAVLRKRVQHDGLAIAGGDVLELIAERIPTNIRALEGALIRVVAFASLTGRVVDGSLAREVLDGLYGSNAAPAPGPARRVSVAEIQRLTCEAFAITEEELLSDSRVARIAWPRQVAMYLAREHTDETLPSIGRQFGGRNHTTVMHAVRRTTERLASDPDAYEAVSRLDARVRSGSDRQD